MNHIPGTTGVLMHLALACGCLAQTAGKAQTAISAETQQQRDARMAWWREARFGLFIHWGLYAIPAGEWQGGTNHAEWIRTTAQIPLDEYEQFVSRFNPVKFDADEWVRMAKDAGMKYIVITSKHHDGFCLFDSEYTDYDVMSTPFKRDIMKELAEACRKAGLKMCWYHSIMDWRHPDYLPRRGWESEMRPAGDADFDRFVSYLHNQVTELLTKYGPIGVMWFDGEWEGTWSHEYGQPLYELCRKLQPNVIVNNRVDKGRAGMAGMTKDRRYAGDFGTPEQEIPAMGMPGADWETCMTMNRHWGYNKNDHDWKSTEDLIRKLVDIASKGGNFLLNVGPKADGTFPRESVDRLREIGEWMKVNGESIYGTSASPFKKLAWGRCTQKDLPNGKTRLYLHVFDWPKNGELVVPGLFNEVKKTRILGSTNQDEIRFSRKEDAVVIRVPAKAPEPTDTVVVLDIVGKPDVAEPPIITAPSDIFVNALDVSITTDRVKVELRYTMDGSKPTPDSTLVDGPVVVKRTTTIRARAFREGRPVSDAIQATFTKVVPRPAANVETPGSGLQFEYYEGEWNRLPDFDTLKPSRTGTTESFTYDHEKNRERFGYRYSGFVTVPRDGVYTFYTLSDDGSRLTIGKKLVVDNDGLHGPTEAEGAIALAAGAHPIRVTFFEKTGGDELEVGYAGPGLDRQPIPAEALFHSRTSPPRRPR